MALRSGNCNKSSNSVREHGLPKTERLKGKQVMRELFSTGKRFHQGDMTIIYLLSDEQAVSFVASKKIGGAIKRNKSRRILREAYRMNKEIFRGLKVVFYVQRPLKLREVIHIIKKFGEGR